VQADTIVPNPTEAVSLNRYSYVHYSPLLFTDPSGHILLITAILIGAAAGAIIGAAVGYGTQVAENYQENGGDLSSAMTTDIRPAPILVGAGIGAAAGAITGAGLWAVTGGAAAAAGSTAGTTATAACADGDCTNEVTTLVQQAEALVNGNASPEQATQYVENIANASTHVPSGGSANVALGNYPEYIQWAEQTGSTYFQMPDEVWKVVQKNQNVAWAINQSFLESMVAQGNSFTYYSGVTEITNGVTAWNGIGKYGMMELEYLSGVGQRVWHSIVEQIR
jgi:hypothetical protein